MLHSLCLFYFNQSLNAPLTVIADGPRSGFREKLGLQAAKPAGKQLGFTMATPPELPADEGIDNT